jgi:hypothetical protein
MKSILTGGLMALAISTAGAAEQNRFSANSMLLACKRFIGEGGQASDAEAGYCAGTIDILAAIGTSISERVVCWDVPDETTTEQRVRVVVRYIEAHPARMHEPMPRLAIEALRDAWPCK